MSEQEKEQELVAGTIGGITQKKADTWTVAVTPVGSEYAKQLWTKDADLVVALGAKLAEAGAFVCNASYWTRDGKQVRSLWIDSVADGTENLPERVPTPAAAPQGATFAQAPVSPRPTFAKLKADEPMSKDDWGRKDSAIHMMAAIKAAADALKHTIPSDPTPEDLERFGERVFILTYRWHKNVIAERDDPTGEDVPF